MRKAFAAGIYEVLQWQHTEIEATTSEVEACLAMELLLRETDDYLRRCTR